MNLWNSIPLEFYEILWALGALHFPKIALVFYAVLVWMFFYRKELRKPLLLFFALSLSGLIGIGTYWAHRNAFITPLLLLAIMVFPFCMAIRSFMNHNLMATKVWLLAFLSGSLFSLGMAAWYTGIARS